MNNYDHESDDNIQFSDNYDDNDFFNDKSKTIESVKQKSVTPKKPVSIKPTENSIDESMNMNDAYDDDDWGNKSASKSVISAAPKIEVEKAKVLTPSPITKKASETKNIPSRVPQEKKAAAPRFDYLNFGNDDNSDEDKDSYSKDEGFESGSKAASKLESSQGYGDIRREVSMVGPALVSGLQNPSPTTNIVQASNQNVFGSRNTKNDGAYNF